MITFRRTQKVRDLLALRDRDLTEEAHGDLHEWFVDTATIERYRCLLFTHKVSLYSFWALACASQTSWHDGGVTVADVRALNRRLNDTPMGALAPGSHMDCPIDVLTRIIRPSGVG